MSYANEVKNELLSLESDNCCLKARAYAMLLFSRLFSGREISFLTEHGGTAEAYCEGIKLISGKDVYAETTAGGKYKINITDPVILTSIAESLGSGRQELKRRINLACIENSCCFNAFISGAFLAAGTVSDPQKDYHLEFSVPTSGLAQDFIKLFDEFDTVPKLTTRGNSYVVYFKNSGDIEDVLTIMGAQEHSLAFMMDKIGKDIRNTVNRRVNFESANIARASEASAKQYEAILTIKKYAGLDSLSENLRKIAQLRLSDRELTTSQIAQMLPEEITVSGVNHRFKKLIEIADKLKMKFES